MDQSEPETVPESSDSTVAVDEQAATSPEAAPESTTDAAPTNGRPDPARGFLAELAHAMRGAAERERERISGEVDASAEAHVEKVRARAATEAAELRRLAEEDIDGIHAWSKEETIRIQQETERRIGTRREELQGYLVRHAAIIDGEVDHIEGAVRQYRAELDRFFAQMASEADPSGLARVADEMPAPPDLGKVGNAARTQAVAALAEERDAADAGVADAVASAEVNGGTNAFHPEQPGPELVPVMGEANGTMNATAVVASVVASGDKPKADAASTDAEAGSDSTTEHPNVAVRLLRSIASTLSAPAEHPAETTESTETAESPEPAADGSATQTDDAKS